MNDTRVLYEDHIPDEMVTKGPVWYASYVSDNCVLTNAYDSGKVRRYDYDTQADLESAMRVIRGYGEAWIPSSPKPEIDLKRSNDIINAFFKESEKD